MLKLLFRGLRARFGRNLLVSLAVVMGVAFLCGTLVYSDTLNKSFENLSVEGVKGADIVVTPKKVSGKRRDELDPPQLPKAMVAKVKSVAGVDRVYGLVNSSSVALFKKDGVTRLGNGFSPSFLQSQDPKWMRTIKFTSGRIVKNDREITVDRATARNAGYKVGDKIYVQGAGQRERLRLSGIWKLSSNIDSIGGATVGVTTAKTAARLGGRSQSKYFESINVKAADDANRPQLVKAIRASVKGAAVVRTAQEEADQRAADFKKQLAFLPTILMVFSFISAFVGGFLIYNTFSITVAQRQRDYALLRAVGASRKQIWVQVIGEALVIGIIGSILGVIVGPWVAEGIRNLMSSFDIQLPSTNSVVTTRTVVWGLLLGLLITMLAVIPSALKAVKVAPVEALRDSAAETKFGQVRRVPIMFGFLLATAGAVMVTVAVTGVVKKQPELFAGIGSAAIFLGLTLFSPLLVAPIARLVGRPLKKVFGLSGHLAQENAIRQPGRTAITAGSLMIGLALVVFATTFAAGLNRTIRGDMEKAIGGNVVVDSGGGFQPVPNKLITDLKRKDRTSRAGGVSYASGMANGNQGSGSYKLKLSVADKATFNGLIKLTSRSAKGNDKPMAYPGSKGVFLAKKDLEKLKVKVGETIKLKVEGDKKLKLKILGEAVGGGIAFDGSWTSTAVGKQLSEVRPRIVIAQTDGGVQRAKKLLGKRYPAAKVLDKNAWIDEQSKQLMQLLGLVYALLALSVLVAVLGIANTLYLAIGERVRELGLLRAVGAARKQVSRMIVLEAVIIALLGSLLGVIVGLVLSLAVGSTIDGFTVSVPITIVAGLVALITVLVVIVAVAPARRAAKTDLLQAIAEQ